MPVNGFSKKMTFGSFKNKFICVSLTASMWLTRGRGRFQRCSHPGSAQGHMTSIPLAHTTNHRMVSKDLKETFPVSCRAEQFHLHTKERVVVTVEDSTLREEMGVPESQEEDTPKGGLWYKTLGFSG